MTTLSRQPGAQTVPTRRKLGDILTSAGVIDEAQLQNALGHQRQWGGRLGHILIDLRVIDENTLARTLAEQLGIQLVDLDAQPLSVELARLVPQSLAERHGVFPVSFDKATNKLMVVFSDPTNLAAVDEVRFQTGKMIQVAVAGEGQIGLAIRRFYYGEDPAAVEQPGEPTTLFGNVSGFLAGEEELAELEPLPLEPLPIEPLPLDGLAEPGPSGELDASPAPAPAPASLDPLSGFLSEADPADELPTTIRGRSEPAPVAPPVLSPAAPQIGQEPDSILDQAVDLTRQTAVGGYTPPLDLGANEPTNPQIEMARFLFSQTQELTRPNVPLAELLAADAPAAAEEPTVNPMPREMSAAAIGESEQPGFSDDDLGLALAGLEGTRPTTGEWNGGEPARNLAAEVPTDGHYARALARVLIRKGLIDEAELLAELANG